MRVLVATDVAARGLDIEALPFVVNYDLPHNPEDYVHRIGRTGRAGASGEAISLVSESETRYLKDIEKLLGSAIESQIVPGFEPDAAEVPAYQSRAPRGPARFAAQPSDVSVASIPSARPVTVRSAGGVSLFDAPYIPSSTSSQPGASSRRAPKQVAALFRVAIKPEVLPADDEVEPSTTP